jgi:Flp pilus assembly protein TadD
VKNLATVATGVLLLAALVLWIGRGCLKGSGPAVETPTIAPSTASEWYARGNELLNGSKDFRGAAEAYRKATELAPSMGEAHYGLGYCLLELDDVEGCLAEIESALSLAPEGANWRKDAENVLVRAHLKKGAREKH